MGQYRKKPVVIEAIQWRPNEMLMKEVIDFFGGFDSVGASSIVKLNGNLTIKTLEGDMTASDGDWIVKGIEGEIYPCKPDIFEKTYDFVS